MGRDLVQPVRALVVALDIRDPQSRLHSDRVARYAFAVGSRLGVPRLDRLVAAALLHDIGILGVPDSLLNRNDRLLPHELDVVREHAVIGSRVLEEAGLTPMSDWVRHHHEHFDGRGYPDGLAGDAIPLESRIIGVVEALETITAARYERPRRANAIDELEDYVGTQFDPQVAETLVELIVAGDLEKFEDPPLLDAVGSSRVHDPEWAVSGRGRRARLGSLSG